MPNSTDNQDLGEDTSKPKPGESKGETNKAESPSDENNFTSDKLKGKKVDADPAKESDKPADV